MNLSIIIPVFNGKNSIKRCLDSILSLRLPSHSLEVIIVDDCSTDNTLSILEDYADRYEIINYLHLPVNKKPGGARNAGIKEAKGDYILFLDSDDTVEPGLVDALSYALKKEVDMLLCHLNKQRAFNGAFKKTPIDMPLHYPFEGVFFLNHYYIPNTMGSCSCYLYKNSFLKKLGHLFEEGLYFEDVDWVEYVAYHCSSIEYDSSIILSYYANPGSILHSMDVLKEADIVLYCSRRMAFAHSVKKNAPSFYNNILSLKEWIESIINFRHLSVFSHESIFLFYKRISDHNGFSWLRHLRWKGFAKSFVLHPKRAMLLLDFCRPSLRVGRWIVHSFRMLKIRKLWTRLVNE